jgi:hypothetical protein
MGRQLAAGTVDHRCRAGKICETNTASPLTGLIAATARWLPTRVALEIAQSEAAERKSLATIITLHTFFIDQFSIIVNNCASQNSRLGEKQWNRLMAAK